MKKRLNDYQKIKVAEAMGQLNIARTALRQAVALLGDAYVEGSHPNLHEFAAAQAEDGVQKAQSVCRALDEALCAEDPEVRDEGGEA